MCSQTSMHAVFLYTDKLPVPVNVQCITMPRGLSVTWNITDVNSSCTESSITHDITVVREANSTVVISMNNVEGNQIEITDSLEPSQIYRIYVRPKLVSGSCETSQAAVVVCTYDQLSTTTTTTTTTLITAATTTTLMTAVPTTLMTTVTTTLMTAARTIMMTAATTTLIAEATMQPTGIASTN